MFTLVSMRGQRINWNFGKSYGTQDPRNIASGERLMFSGMCVLCPIFSFDSGYSFLEASGSIFIP